MLFPKPLAFFLQSFFLESFFPTPSQLGMNLSLEVASAMLWA